MKNQEVEFLQNKLDLAILSFSLLNHITYARRVLWNFSVK